MSADRDITPRVVAHLAAHLPDIPRADRVSLNVAQLVLRHLARWARATDTAGHWTSDDSASQVETGTFIPERTVQRAFRCLEALGLTVTVKHGGGQGLTARGSTRILLLDPAGQPGSTARAKRAQFDPQLRALAQGTARATTRTARAQARNTASSPASSPARVAPPDAIPSWLAERWADKLK